ncbi:hypothetical protein HY251_20475 [bacterium]|nr:hypothetical protein [bacterium]
MEGHERPAPSLEELGAPAEVASALRELQAELARSAGANLAGLVLYGGLARRRYRPGKSDVNLAVLLRDASGAELAKIAPGLRAAWRAARIEPWILTPDEVRKAADVFPTKLQDIQAHHVALSGEDPFHDLTVEREHVRLRIEQELRNLALRLRRRFISTIDDRGALAAGLAATVAPLAVELAALVRLSGKQVPEDDTPAAVFAAAAAAFDLDREALARLAGLALETSAPDDAASLYGRVLQAVARSAEAADALHERR